MEFHISRELRDRLQLDDTLFRYTGDVVFGNVAASRKLAQRLNELRVSEEKPGQPSGIANAGALFAMGLIDELNHAMIARFRENLDPSVLTEALRFFTRQNGAAAVNRLLRAFTELFPSVSVYRGQETQAQWLAGATDGLPNREAAFEELLMLWLANINPAFQPFRELFADAPLAQATAYKKVTAALPQFFETRPLVAPEIGTLLDALCAPMLASPDSLTGQLDFIRDKWQPQLGSELKRVLLAVDVLREEDIAIWMRFHPASPDNFRHAAPGRGGDGFIGDEYVGFDAEFGPGTPGFDAEFIIGPDGKRQRRYDKDYQAPLNEYEAFSVDQAWMPNVVMMAKSTYVWLEQLSQKYGRHIHRLDQVPDEELNLLADRGITALWLIGLWERSTASRTIKHLRGHADAVASAYSLKEYLIAEDLGGNAGYEDLRDRAVKFGIRLASDMVPNHMGIDSNWVIEHPEWFLSRPESPFPVYTFDGPDLSPDSRVEIKIEDHYYDQTDAAVAFRIRNHRDGSTSFMYHGNDGTTFAWNDTAQLDYSKAVVREQVMQTILYVARLFPIIRFDAAMVLAKRHVQRLWFPLPGAGGSIPSRAEDAISQEEFEALMPVEFWREVVDRVAVEVPGTLLLAEAFWLLEGYFVRTLGMHRVYNSAFMNMLRDEENAKYRSYLKKTVEFDPDILKRYVNFMSNPDERTAIDQFGDGDKFFGCCTLLATLPGLPMFGHGQIEGFTERYGMEFKQAKFREIPNEHLIARHQHEIAPLLKRRAEFAESENFLLYDFWKDDGTVDENVFAYSNRLGRGGAGRSIVVYNNIYGSTHGTLHVSAASVDKGSGQMLQRTLAEGLALPAEDWMILGWRDSVSGLKYLRRVTDLRSGGLTLPLRGYQYVVLLDWRELQPTAEKPWDRLCDALNGAGVQSLDDALRNLKTRPLIEALRQALVPEALAHFAGNARKLAEAPDPVWSKTTAAAHRKTAQRFQPFFDRVAETGLLEAQDRERSTDALEQLLEGAASLILVSKQFSSGWPEAVIRVLPTTTRVSREELLWAPLLAWAALTAALAEDAPALFDQLQLRAALAEVFSSLGLEGEQSWQAAARVRLLLSLGQPAAPGLRTAAFWKQPDVRWLSGVTEAFGMTYVNQESFEALICALQIPRLVSSGQESVLEIDRQVVSAKSSMAEAEYTLDRWLAPPAPAAPEEVPPPADSTQPLNPRAAVKKAPSVKVANSKTAKKSPAKKTAAKTAKTKKISLKEMEKKLHDSHSKKHPPK